VRIPVTKRRQKNKKLNSGGCYGGTHPATRTQKKSPPARGDFLPLKNFKELISFLALALLLASSLVLVSFLP